MSMPRYTIVIDTEGKEHIYKLASKKCGDCGYFVAGREWCEFGEISRQKLNEACGDWKVKLPIPVVETIDEQDHFIDADPEILDEIASVFEENEDETVNNGNDDIFEGTEGQDSSGSDD